MRERFRGARVVRVEESKIVLADLSFTYHSPIVEVYLDDPSSDEHASAVTAPPWSSVPWHLLALMEAAVERGIAAFSQSEAARRGLPWLDLVRDEAQLAKLRALIKEFAQMSYRPPTLEGLVTPEAAKARWEALDTFAAEKGHLLVTNGPYRLRSWLPEATTLDVVREFTYPVGLGTFNPYTYPPRAIITTVTRVGDSIAIAADVEMAVKAQRDHVIVRAALKRDTLRDIPTRSTPTPAMRWSARMERSRRQAPRTGRRTGALSRTYPPDCRRDDTQPRRRYFSTGTRSRPTSGASRSARTEQGIEPS
jgi:hypothetical protein